LVLALVLGLLASPWFSRATAQIPARIGQTIKQRAEDRKRKSEDSLVNRIGDRADTLLNRGVEPIDGMIAKTMDRLDSIVVKSYRSLKGSDSEAERDLREALKVGRIDLDLGFAQGGTAFSPDGEALVGALARVLRKSKDDFVLEGRYMNGEEKTLARKRALAVLVMLSELDVNPSQLHLVPRATVASDRSVGVIPVR
jgi:hypothetical protein